MSEPIVQGYPRSKVHELLQRWWIRKRRWRRIPDQPIVHLLPDAEPDRLIDELAGHLHQVVPNAVLDVAERSPVTRPAGNGRGPEEPERLLSRRIRENLDEAARTYLDHSSAKRIGRLRFRRYALLSWLLNQNVQPNDELANRPNPQTRRLLKDYFGPRKKQPEQSESSAWAAAEQQLPWYLFIGALLTYPLYYAWRIRFGAIPRWFMRQRYLSPGDSEDFPAFAQRLITTPSKRENAEQVRKLLVHAFLADLADAYARGPRWRWIPKDSYPVLLLRGLEPGTIGETLVRLVNDVRNETVIRDPLLVVGSGTRQLPHEPEPDGGTLEEWPVHLQTARRQRSPTAWYRPAAVTGAPDGEDGLPPMGRELPLHHSLAWRRVPATAAVLALLAAGGLYLHQYFGPCGQLQPVHQIGPWGSDTEVWAEGGECVGISDGGFSFAPDIPASDAHETRALRDQLQQVQTDIVALNEDIAADHRRVRSRPYVTVVYFGTLTAPDPNSSTLNAALEELRGIRHAQEKAWRDSPVLLRVVFANGGNEMAHAPEVAERIDALAQRRADSDAPVVGVVGLGGSWSSTKTAIAELGTAGLPSIGTTTSADGLVEATPLYHQVAPNNQRQADVVAQYLRARHQPLPKIKIFYAENDLYSKNLAHDLDELLPAQLDPNDLNSWDQDIPCGRDDLLFFAGRADRLGKFLNDVAGACRSRDQEPPLLMAGDDVNKFMLDRELPTGVTLEYTSFYGHTEPESDLRGRATLASDAVEVLRYAVMNVTGGRVATDGQNPVPLSGLAVWHGIASSGYTPVPGITGNISYTGRSGQVPQDKAISVLRLTGGSDEPDVVWMCETGCRPGA
ncbi:hypothetical protein [Saccharopolyspora griseoalba]|uniref:ABC transporter substrate-binding protein n=1 Tax=Saccharopolyspora griseoalba TaxID=1431848 RepID=A0ABW2LLY2_9PSEU